MQALVVLSASITQSRIFCSALRVLVHKSSLRFWITLYLVKQISFCCFLGCCLHQPSGADTIIAEIRCIALDWCLVRLLEFLAWGRRAQIHSKWLPADQLAASGRVLYLLSHTGWLYTLWFASILRSQYCHIYGSGVHAIGLQCFRCLMNNTFLKQNGGVVCCSTSARDLVPAELAGLLSECSWNQDCRHSYCAFTGMQIFWFK